MVRAAHSRTKRRVRDVARRKSTPELSTVDGRPSWCRSAMSFVTIRSALSRPPSTAGYSRRLAKPPKKLSKEEMERASQAMFRGLDGEWWAPDYREI